jgi:hypothetical protein
MGISHGTEPQANEIRLTVIIIDLKWIDVDQLIEVKKGYT